MWKKGFIVLSAVLILAQLSGLCMVNAYAKEKEELKKYCDNINQVIEGKEVGELEDFVAAVDSYTKFLDNNVELNQAADLALADLVNQKK